MLIQWRVRPWVNEDRFKRKQIFTDIKAAQHRSGGIPRSHENHWVGGGAQERFFWYISRYFTAGRSMQGCVHNEALGLWLTAMIFHAKIVIILVGVFWPSDYYEYIGEYFWPSSAPCLQMQNPSSSYDSPLVTLEVILGAEMFCCLRHEMYCLLFQHANELASISGHVTNPRPAYSWSLNTGHNRLLYKHVRGVFFDGKSE